MRHFYYVHQWFSNYLVCDRNFIGLVYRLTSRDSSRISSRLVCRGTLFEKHCATVSHFFSICRTLAAILGFGDLQIYHNTKFENYWLKIHLRTFERDSPAFWANVPRPALNSKCPAFAKTSWPFFRQYQKLTKIEFYTAFLLKIL
jgi:hypothetical protein